MYVSRSTSQPFASYRLIIPKFCADPFFETGCQAALTRVHASPRQGICIVLCSIKQEALTLTPSFILISIDFASVEGCRRVERELCAICSAEAAAITDPESLNRETA